jgi:hypothetical protein
MAAPKYLLSDYEVNIDDDMAVKEGRRSFKQLKQASPLRFQLNVGRALLVGRRAIQAELGYETNDTRGGPYATALNRWLADNGFAGLSEHLRIDSMWVLDNWADCRAHLKAIEETEPSRLQVMGVRGLRERVEEALRNGPRNRKMTPNRRGPTPTQQLQARIDELELAMAMSGLAFETEGGTFVVGNRRSHMIWRDGVDNWREGDKPNAAPPGDAAKPNGDGAGDDAKIEEPC